jgi:hypothetical protein
MKGWLLLGALPLVRVAVPVGEEGGDRLAATAPTSIAGPRRGRHTNRATRMLGRQVQPSAHRFSISRSHCWWADPTQRRAGG